MMDQNKNLLRKEFRQKRRDLSGKQRKLLSREVCQNFYSNISLPKKTTIAGYIATDEEVDISLLLEMYEEDGHSICLPTVESGESPMIFRKYSRRAKLEKNEKYKFLEPEKPAAEIIPYLIITPLVAFDSACNRLGMGGGFYDRTLNKMADIQEFISIGVAFSIQQTAYIKPEKYDFMLDAIVTENRIFFGAK